MLSRLRKLNTSERTRNTRELQRLADALHNAAFGVAVVDAGTNTIQFANPAYAALRGNTVEQIRGTHVLDAYNPAERTRVQALLETADRDGRVSYRAEYTCPDGSVRPVRLDITSVSGQTGEVLYRVGTAQDITRQQQVEAALRQAQKMEAIGNLAGGMAHDFNNLLAIIIGNLDIISSLLEERPDITELMTDATNAAMRGADLTRNLLAFARRQSLKPVELQVNAVIEDITRLLARTLRENVTIALDLSPAAWPITADRSQLESCIVNLANNARDAMPQGGRLRIATANRQIDADCAAAMDQELRPGDYVMIEVADSGIGMPPNVLKRIFERFFSARATDEGNGLGLSMVFGFVSQSGGHISVDSNSGSGTTFRLFLPRGVTSEPLATLAPAAALPLDGHGATVLVVEDNAPLRRIVVRQLIRLGYAVIEADNAEAALCRLAGTPVHVLLTDVVMPGGMSGFELAQHARQVQPNIKVLLTSGFSQPAADRPAVPTADVAQLLRKPYRTEDLASGLFATLHG